MPLVGVYVHARDPYLFLVIDLDIHGRSHIAEETPVRRKTQRATLTRFPVRPAGRFSHRFDHAPQTKRSTPFTLNWIIVFPRYFCISMPQRNARCTLAQRCRAMGCAGIARTLAYEG
jgi:hypothetical protein